MMELIEKSEAIRVSSGYCHFNNIPKEIENLPSIKAIPVEDLESLLKGMRDKAYLNMTQGTEYHTGYTMAISYIEGWLVEKECEL